MSLQAVRILWKAVRKEWFPKSKGGIYPKIRAEEEREQFLVCALNPELLQCYDQVKMKPLLKSFCRGPKPHMCIPRVPIFQFYKSRTDLCLPPQVMRPFLIWFLHLSRKRPNLGFQASVQWPVSTVHCLSGHLAESRLWVGHFQCMSKECISVVTLLNIYIKAFQKEMKIFSRDGYAVIACLFLRTLCECGSIILMPQT